MNEFDLINTYFKVDSCCDVKETVVPNGDDCAVVRSPQNDIAISVDTCIEGRHFLKGTPPDLVAHRAFRTALSDLAAMGATPRWTTLALTLPSSDQVWLKGFHLGLTQVLQEFNCELIGGDTTRGALSVTFQVMGKVHNRLTERSGANVGDGIYVTNTLGNGAASLFCLQALQENDTAKTFESFREYAHQYFYKPALTFKAARHINSVATSAIDISDGLFSDLAHVCRASKVSAELSLDLLPFNDETYALSKIYCDDAAQIYPNDALNWAGVTPENTQKQMINWALFGGDDYQLCFTAAENEIKELRKTSACIFHRIGDITSAHELGENIRLSYGEHPVEKNKKHSGYTHF